MPGLTITNTCLVGGGKEMGRRGERLRLIQDMGSDAKSSQSEWAAELG